MRCVVLAAVVAAVGCGPAGPPVGPPVDGTVTVDGKPADRVQVAFYKSGGKRPIAVAGATSGPDGGFKVPPSAELLPGDYRLTASRPKGKSSPAAPDFAAMASDLPAVYADPQQSPLKATVGPGPTTVKVELSSDPAAGAAR